MLLLKVGIELNYIHKHELGELERQILDFILDSDEVTQRELSRVFGRAKACRAVKNLKNMGLIQCERKGKTYIIKVV